MGKPITIKWSEVTHGKTITVWDVNERGQGGIVVSVDPDHLTIVNPLGTPFTYEPNDIDCIETEVPYELSECIEYTPGVCRGEVQPFSPRGFGGPLRCGHHIDKRIESYENSMERYANSDVVPDWFDPNYAGERWDDD